MNNNNHIISSVLNLSNSFLILFEDIFGFRSGATLSPERNQK